MRLFLDTSVLVAASASCRGASREIFERAERDGWILITTNYVLNEVDRNLPQFGQPVVEEWSRLRRGLIVMRDVFTLDRPSIFPVRKDKPILYGAAAWADLLITLDQADFGSLIGGAFYGIEVLRPGQFIERERVANRTKR